MSIVFVYAPFATPASPPYGLASLTSFIAQNSSKLVLNTVDLNLEFHHLAFSSYAASIKKGGSTYAQDTIDFLRDSRACYAANNRKIRQGEQPDHFDALLAKILDLKPSVVVFSVVFSSQAFYAYALLKKLKELGILTVVGGPSVSHKIIDVAATHLKNEVELLEYLTQTKVNHADLICNKKIDFSMFPVEDYFSPAFVLPLKSCNTCYYQKCTFCTHHTGAKYEEYPIADLVDTIKQSGAKHVFLIDDMIHKNRLREIAAAFTPLGISWMVQLRPTKDIDHETLRLLRESGLRVVYWGVESGSDRVLKAMKKGTNTHDVARVLSDSHEVGIFNGAYVLFGFPTETTAEFLQTISFLKENKSNIDIVHSSTFGLQDGAPILEKPESFGLVQIQSKKRDMLDPKLTYTVESGMSQEESKVLKRKYKKTLDNFNSYPKEMNFFREHLLVAVARKSK
jgi:hypothetical protein